MQKILIPTDFSENASRAISYASALYADIPTLFILIHIQKSTDLPQDNETAYVEKIQEITEYLENCKKRFQNELHEVTSVFHIGGFIENIRKIVDSKEIDLIAMGTRGVNNAANMPIGTNTQDVITKVQCPVLVVPNRTEFSPIHEVVFPTDLYLRYSSKTMEPLTSLLIKNKSMLHIVYRTAKKSLLSKNQLINKEFLNKLHKDIGVVFHEIISANLREELEKYIAENETQLIAMSAKNLNFIQLLLSKSSPQTDSYIRHIPFLFLHENI